jgi:mRNA-degrading endonuclease RelE of RelBE toxin-antitoxin system
MKSSGDWKNAVKEESFKVILSESAERDIQNLEAEHALRLVKDIKTYLEKSPLPFGKTRIKKLSGFKPPLYRIRSGDFRAYYRIISRDVVILAITHKKDSEKYLRKLR